MVKFRDRGAYWLAENKVGAFLQVSGFEMFAAPVLNYVAQLYTLPHIYAKEVLDISAKFMLGPGAWLKGGHNHPYFRARVDLGMKAVPRCIASQNETMCYMSTRYSLLSAGSRVAILEKSIGHNEVFENMYSTIYHTHNLPSNHI